MATQINQTSGELFIQIIYFHNSNSHMKIKQMKNMKESSSLIIQNFEPSFCDLLQDIKAQH